MTKRADVTVHIDEELDESRSDEVCAMLRGLSGIYDVKHDAGRRHLYVVEFDPDAINSHAVLDHVTGQGLHAELIGM